jgi:hypothetical protein
MGQRIASCYRVDRLLRGARAPTRLSLAVLDQWIARAVTATSAADVAGE